MAMPLGMVASYSIRRKTARTLLIKDYANSLTNINNMKAHFLIKVNELVFKRAH